MFNRPWAFWRRTQYIIGVLLFVGLIGSGLYFLYFYEAANCFDGVQNGNERGIDCGGSCARVCAIDVTPPRVLWAEAFKVTNGQYNAVAYVENTNISVGSPEVQYTFTLSDRTGTIATRSGATVLPPDSVYPLFEGRINTGSRVPTKTELTLEGAEPWLSADIGREQFTVEEYSLAGIDSNPRLDARIANNALTAAQDVEIVATVFDSNRNPLTASRTLVENFPSRTTQSVVFTWPEPIAKTIRSCAVPTDVVLALDLSGSMNDDGGTPPEPVTSVLNAASAFVARLSAQDRVGVVTYASNAVLRRQLTQDSAGARSTITSFAINPAEETGSTNIGDALLAARSELDSARHNDDARKVLVLLTDGLANAPDETPERYALDAADSLKATDTEIFTIGLGNSVNENFLREVSSGEGYYFRAVSAATIDRIYQSVTEAICEDGPAVIEIIPKTNTNFTPVQ